MWIIIGLVVVTVLAGVSVWLYFDTYHLATVQADVLYRDGNRSLRELKNALGRIKPRTVVSLVDDRELEQSPFKEEVDYCRERGITLVRIPIRLGGWPTTAHVRQFLDLVAEPARRPVLVHCAQGVRRTGMMVAAYQMSVMGLDAQRAKDAILTFGHSERSIGDVKRFIDIYDATQRQVTQELALSKE